MYLLGPLALAAGLPLAVIAVDHWCDLRQERRLATAGLLPMDRRDPPAFATAIADFLRARGWSVARVRGAGPAPARIRPCTVVSVRRWRRPRGAREVLKIAAAHSAGRGSDAIAKLVTTGRLTLTRAAASRTATRVAAALAPVNGMDLWDRRRMAGARKPPTVAPR